MVNITKLNELFSSTTDECDIRVNQRELIMKILARYSGEFTVLRELIQNANDAKASQVCIQLDPESRVIYIENNGMIFRDIDWDRITTVAYGNPDENTVGCFGVGFYSVFSISEYPTIISGNKMLQFRFKKHRLVTKLVDADKYHEKTTFVFENVSQEIFDKWSNREKNDIFLKSALYFSEHIKEISMSIESNSCNTTHLAKKAISSSSIEKYNTFSSENIKTYFDSCDLNTFHLCGTQSNNVVQVSTVLHIAYSDQYSASMKKYMTKKLPSKTKIQILLNASDVGQLYIGYKTQQTTGIGIDINAQFIATVERENIDLNDYLIKEWNTMLLCNIGYLIRKIYDQCCFHNSSTFSYTHMIHSLSYKQSTPISLVGKTLIQSFLQAQRELYIRPTHGPHIHERVSINACLFVEHEFIDDSSKCVETLVTNPFVIGTLEDNTDRIPFYVYLVKNKLFHCLDVKRVAKFITKMTNNDINKLLSWLLYLYRSGSKHAYAMRSVVFKHFKLEYIKYFENSFSRKYDTKAPCIVPSSYIQTISTFEMEKYFQWSYVEWTYWLQHFFKKHNNIHHVSEVLKYVSVRFDAFEAKYQVAIVDFLKTCACIPSSFDDRLHVPSQTYFSSVNIKTLHLVPENITKLNEPFYERIGVRDTLSIHDLMTCILNDNSVSNTVILNALLLRDLTNQEINTLRAFDFSCTNKTRHKPDAIYFYDIDLESLGFSVLPLIVDDKHLELLHTLHIKMCPS